MVESDPTVEPIPGTSGALVTQKGSRASAAARRGLTEKEITSPAYVMTLLEDLDRLEGEIAKLRALEERNQAKSEELAVLKSQKSGRVWNEIVHSVTLSTGFAALGYAPAIWSVSVGPVVLAAGLVLIIVAIAAKWGTAK